MLLKSFKFPWNLHWVMQKFGLIPLHLHLLLKEKQFNKLYCFNKVERYDGFYLCWVLWQSVFYSLIIPPTLSWYLAFLEAVMQLWNLWDRFVVKDISSKPGQTIIYWLVIFKKKFCLGTCQYLAFFKPLSQKLTYVCEAQLIFVLQCSMCV